MEKYLKNGGKITVKKIKTNNSHFNDNQTLGTIIQVNNYTEMKIGDIVTYNKTVQGITGNLKIHALIIDVNATNQNYTYKLEEYDITGEITKGTWWNITSLEILDHMIFRPDSSIFNGTNKTSTSEFTEVENILKGMGYVVEPSKPDPASELYITAHDVYFLIGVTGLVMGFVGFISKGVIGSERIHNWMNRFSRWFDENVRLNVFTCFDPLIDPERIPLQHRHAQVQIVVEDLHEPIPVESQVHLRAGLLTSVNGEFSQLNSGIKIRSRIINEMAEKKMWLESKLDAKESTIRIKNEEYLIVDLMEMVDREMGNLRGEFGPLERSQRQYNEYLREYDMKGSNPSYDDMLRNKPELPREILEPRIIDSIILDIIVEV